MPTQKYVLLNPVQMSFADARSIERGIAGIVLMENAGGAVANAIMERFPRGRIAVLCGPGNNGGDGFIAARHLRDNGWQVEVFLSCRPEELRGDAAEAARRWAGSIHPLSVEAGQGASLVLDALYGAGLSRDIAGVEASLVARLNGSGVPVIAVDVPSGLDGGSGEIRGQAFRAALTVTFFRKKPGHLLMPGRALCGEVILADIGIEEDVLDEIASRVWENNPALWASSFPMPGLDSHKYSRGHALVLCGGAAQTGAARLAARGALRTGAGLVTIGSPPEALAVNAAHLTAIMLAEVGGPDVLSRILEDRRKNVCLIGPGCGIGQQTRENVLAALLSGAAMVLDADALTSFAEIPRDLFVAIKGYFAGPTVLTPHEGEFRRLFPKLAGGRLARAQAAAAEAGAIMVLKGPDTVIAAPDGRACINSNAGPELATAGSGDVLAGIVTGLLAQGVPAFEAACMAVWLHGEAGRMFGRGLIAEDLPEMLPAVFRGLLSG